MRPLFVAFVLVIAAFSPASGGPMGFEIFSSGFQREQHIPEKFTCKGPDVSPALRWTGAPQGTQSFAIVMDDPDAPAGTWVHWVAWNIPPSVTELMENVPKEPELKDGT